MNTLLLRNQPSYTSDRETAPAMWLVGTLWLFHAMGVQTNNRSALLEQVMLRGLGPPTHRHPLAVEEFYSTDYRSDNIYKASWPLCSSVSNTRPELNVVDSAVRASVEHVMKFISKASADSP